MQYRINQECLSLLITAMNPRLLKKKNTNFYSMTRVENSGLTLYTLFGLQSLWL